MKSSALQLRHYIVTDLSVTANQLFDPEKKVHLGIQDVVASPECTPDKKNPREWQIALRIKHSQNTDSNSPYFFMIEMVGFFAVKESVPETEVAKFAEVNGASLLYTTAREILRTTMAMGPYRPLLLPAVCFFDPKPKTEDKQLTENKPKVAIKAPARKKA